MCALRARGYAAAAVALLAGCGRIGFAGDQPDAGPGTDPDAALPTDRVSVVTRSRGGPPGPAPGVIVWTSHADGSLDELGETDEAGRAALRVDPGGGSVSAAYPGTPYMVRTVIGVELGDLIRFGEDNRPCDQTPRGQATITWAAFPDAAGYRISSTCDGFTTSTATSRVWDLTAGIPDPMDVVVQAIGSSGQLIATATRIGVPLGDGATVAFTAADWLAPVPRDIGVTGLPAFAMTGELFIFFRTPNDPTAGGGDYLFEPPTEGALIASVGAPSGADVITVFGSALGSPTEHAIGFQHWFDPASNGTIAALTMPSLASDLAYDETTHRVSWSEVPGPTDRLLVTVSYGTSYRWEVFLPGGATSVALPEPPAGVMSTIPGMPPAISVHAAVFAPRIAWPELRLRPEWGQLTLQDSVVSASIGTSFTAIAP
jgi:hypothetical protein